MTDKTKTPRELALEALKKPPSQADDAIIPRGYSSRNTWNAAIDACIEALSQEQPEPIGKVTEAQLKQAIMWLNTRPNAPMHFTKAGNEVSRDTLKKCVESALQTIPQPDERKEMIAALYVETNGCYFNQEGIDPWDETRDARLYDGPYPVIAHPPCQRWGKMWMGQPLWVKRTGQRKIKGDDGGCFKHALETVRKYGGVIEHPERSHAWSYFNLNEPPRTGGWIAADFLGGWTCCVEQGRYGHYARKPTWLYAFGCELPELDWGKGEHRIPQWAIDKYGIERAKKAGELAFKGGGTDSSPRIGTPEAFREILISMAKSVRK